MDKEKRDRIEYLLKKLKGGKFNIIESDWACDEINNTCKSAIPWSGIHSQPDDSVLTECEAIEVAETWLYGPMDYTNNKEGVRSWDWVDKSLVPEDCK